MDFIAGICALLLVAIGIWFYNSTYRRPLAKKSREASEIKLLKSSTSLTEELQKYLNRLSTVQAAEILRANGEFISETLWDEMGAMFVEMGRVGKFTALLNDPKPETRLLGAEVLGYMKVPGGAQSLVQTLGDKDEAVRLASVAALVRLRDPAIAGSLAKALGNPGKLLPARVAEVLLSLGDKAVEPLLEEMKTAGQEGQYLICEVLGQLGDPGALPMLVKVLETSSSSRVRASAAEALGSIPCPDNISVQALTSALRDAEWEVRARAAKALGQAGRPESFSALDEAAANDENWNVRAIAEAALAGLSSKGTAQ